MALGDALAGALSHDPDRPPGTRLERRGPGTDMRRRSVRRTLVARGARHRSAWSARSWSGTRWGGALATAFAIQHPRSTRRPRAAGADFASLGRAAISWYYTLADDAVGRTALRAYAGAAARRVARRAMRRRRVFAPQTPPRALCRRAPPRSLVLRPQSLHRQCAATWPSSRQIWHRRCRAMARSRAPTVIITGDRDAHRVERHPCARARER